MFKVGDIIAIRPQDDDGWYVLILSQDDFYWEILDITNTRNSIGYIDKITYKSYSLVTDMFRSLGA